METKATLKMAVKMIIVNKLSFSVVKDEELLRFAQAMNPDY